MYITVAASKITLIVAQIYTTAVSILYCIIAINTQYIVLTYTIAERKKNYWIPSATDIVKMWPDFGHI